jgi:hypothetical protein
MKITINKTTAQEVELPKYFKNDRYGLFMIIDDSRFLKVYDIPFDGSYAAIPYFRIEEMAGLPYNIDTGFTPISESEFKAAYLRVSVLYDEIFSN